MSSTFDIDKINLSKYYEELIDIRVAYCKAGCITSIVLVMLGVGLDFSIYPEHFWHFFGARLLVSFLTFLIFLLIRTPYGRTHVRVLTLTWLALPQIMICTMIAITEGVSSIYFVGLHLALYAVGIIVPISFMEGILFGVFTCAIYGAACFLNTKGIADVARFTANTLFIAFSASISVVCSYFAELSRLKLFDLKEELSEKNNDLENINKALTDVKGQLIQKEKMAALGTLSAGLLHEINNPVNFTQMALEMALLEPEMAQNAFLKDAVVDARGGMERVQGIITDLKTFAYQKPEGGASRPFLMEKAISSAIRLTSFDLVGAVVDVDLPQDTHVMGDEPAIIGVLVNLLNNAGLAMQKAGVSKPKILVRARPEGKRLHVSVRDNGVGIPAKNLGRVFEPFFTTRDVGQGLGLGLSMGYTIIQRHGGELRVNSEEGLWTEFSLDLALVHAVA